MWKVKWGLPPGLVVVPPPPLYPYRGSRGLLVCTLSSGRPSSQPVSQCQTFGLHPPCFWDISHLGEKISHLAPCKKNNNKENSDPGLLPPVADISTVSELFMRNQWQQTDLQSSGFTCLARVKTYGYGWCVVSSSSPRLQRNSNRVVDELVEDGNTVAGINITNFFQFLILINI